MINTNKSLSCVLLISNGGPLLRSDRPCKAGYLIYHPERNILVPKFCPITSYGWRWLDNIRDAGIIYVPPRVKRKFASQKSVQGGYLYVIGGFDIIRKKLLRTVVKYDFISGTWFHCAKMKERRSCFTPFLHDGKIFCAGGYISKHTLTNSVEYYEPQMDIMYYGESLIRPVANYGIISYRNNVYLIGGIMQTRTGIMNSSNQFWSLVEVLIENPEDPEDTEVRLQWIEIQKAFLPLDDGISGHRAVLCEEKQRIYLVGGTCQNAKNKPLYKGLFYMDLVNLSKKAIEDENNVNIWMKREVSEFQMSHHASVMIDNKLYAFGGSNNVTNATVTIDEVDEETVNSAVNPLLKTSKERSCNITFKSVNENVGYFDWRRKLHQTIFQLKNSGNFNLEKLEAFVIDLSGHQYKDFEADRLDWLIQWSLW